MIVTPGAATRTGDGDWLYKEIDWWLANRPGVAPIVLNTVPSDNERWFPEPVHAMWRNLNWLPLSDDPQKNQMENVFDRVTDGVGGRMPAWLRSELERERHRRTIIKRYLFAAVVFGVVAAILAGITWFEYQNARKAATAERTAKEDAKTKEALAVQNAEQAKQAELAAMHFLGIATTGMTDAITEEGLRRIDDSPAEAVRLAELASPLTDSPRIGELFRSAAIAHPVWCRIGFEDASSDKQEFIPDPPRVSDPFATDKRLSLILGPVDGFSYPPHKVADSLFGNVLQDFGSATSVGAEVPSLDWKRTAKSVLALREVPSGKVVASLPLLKEEWLMAPDPSATRLVCTRVGEKDSWQGRVFELTAAGLSTPALTFRDGRDVAFTDGDWPCFILSANGTVSQYLSPQNSRVLGKWPEAIRVYAHPSGNAIVLSTTTGLTWIGLHEAAPTTVQIPWPGSHLTAEGVRQACTIRWGPQPHHVLVYRLDAKAGEKPKAHQLLTTLSAINVKTGRVQSLAEYPIRANALTRLICETDNSGRRVAITSFEQSTAEKIIETPGSTVQVMTLSWRPEGTVPPADAAKAVVDVHVRPGGLLRGERLPATKVSVRAISMSPNGKFLVVASDRRTSSGTGFGIGLVEDWRLDSLDEQSSSAPEARKLHIGPMAVLRIAYSRDGSRVAFWDHQGTSHVFRVAVDPSGSFDTHRLPPDLVRRLSPETQAYGPRGQYILADYGGVRRPCVRSRAFR